jgi:CheY-like chemotaxis protein
LEKTSILIIDDSEDDRYLLKRQLKELDVIKRVFEVGDGQAGLEFLSKFEENKKLYLDEFPPDIIFLDINMPRLGGFAFLKEFQKLREGNKFKSLVLLMFTSSEAEADQKKALSYDFVRGYVVKMPKSAQELYEILKKALQV